MSDYIEQLEHPINPNNGRSGRFGNGWSVGALIGPFFARINLK